MKLVLGVVAGVVLLSVAAGAQSPRQRTFASSNPTVYADNVIGDDSCDGSSPTIVTPGATCPVKTVQRCLDYAGGNFDIAPAYAWQPGAYYIGEQPGVVCQLAPASCAAPYVLPVQAFFRDGSHVVTLRGDPSSPAGALNHCLRADAVLPSGGGLQGITAQMPGRLNVLGLAIFGAHDSTLINCLSGGQLSVDMVWFGPAGGPNATPGGPPAPMGAAAGCQLEIGRTFFWGSIYGPIVTGIEESKIILKPSARFHFNNCGASFIHWFGLQHATLWTQGNPPAFTYGNPDSPTTMPLVGCVGANAFSVTQTGYFGILYPLSVVPGSGAYTLSQSSMTVPQLAPNAPGP